MMLGASFCTLNAGEADCQLAEGGAHCWDSAWGDISWGNRLLSITVWCTIHREGVYHEWGISTCCALAKLIREGRNIFLCGSRLSVEDNT